MKSGPLKPTKSKESKEKAKLAEHPFPIRLDESQEADIKELQDRTGLSKTALLRMALCYSLPRFATGEINIMEFLGKK